MFVTHDLSVVKYISDDIMVMYLGQMVEKTFRRALSKSNAPVHQGASVRHTDTR